MRKVSIGCYGSTMDENAMLGSIKQKGIDISREERYAYYRSPSNSPPNIEPIITSIREPYKEEKSLRDGNPVVYIRE